MNANSTQPSGIEPMQLSGKKRKLLEAYLKGQAARQQNAGPTISPRPAGGQIPLSYPQQQVWVHSQLAGEVPIYNETITIYRNGPLDIAVLERCLLEIIRRHEIWRTTFESLNERAVQLVQPLPNKFPLPTHDLRYLPSHERETRARDLATDDARRYFDLKTGPLLRAIVVRMGEGEYRIYMTFHQIVFDAVSAYRVLMPELSSLYDAFSTGKPSPLAEPALQYADFAYWQQKTSSDAVWSKQISSWREKLSGELPILGWPNDHPRPVRQSHRGAIQRFHFDSELVQRLKAFCREEGVSSYMTLLASYMALLNRYTGQEDIVVGGISAGRKWPETEALVGDFVNPVPFRADLSGDPTFRELTKRVMRVVLDGLADDQVPFEKIVEKLQLRPDPGRNPIFQIILSQQPQLPAALPEWELATEEISNGGAKMDMMVVIDERADAIGGPITYNTDLFDDSTLDQMLKHWQTVLRCALSNPQCRISEIPLLTDAERTELLSVWNATEKGYEPDACVHRLIEEQAERRPAAAAVEMGERRLSYREVNERANQLAHYLMGLGVGPEVLVGISLERSAEMVVALLGVLKAGGAYVPLDPSYPQERLSFMVEDSGLKVLLTEESLGGLWAESAVEVVCVDRDWAVIARGEKENPAVVAQPNQLAYVLYTSGSTGKPKGVEILHGALGNFLLSMQEKPGLGAEDTLLAVTTLSFDIAGLELYLPLVSGGKVVIASREEAYDPARLMERMEESGCTVMQATPATWRALVDAGWPGSPELKLLCGGEALAGDLAQELLPRCGELWNMYGPTETTIWSTVSRVTSAEGVISIGQPIANTQVYVLDGNRKLLPVGVTGELYIGGAGLARGYWRRPELSAERFIESPFEAGARLYRTGDVARWRPDGNVECLGRVDNQVKIRGFRIELGEIEAVLGRQRGVRQCVVAVREDAPGEKQLVAYLEPEESSVPGESELRAQLKQELPAYMMPAAFVVLDKLPLTPNGKIDRKALPAPSVKGFISESGFVAPRDPLESTLSHLWVRILKLKQVGVYDNFFDLGGHSLLAVRLIVQIEKLFGRRLPLAVLLQAQTISELARVLRTENWTPSWSSLVPLRPSGSKPPLFLMHAHGGNVLEYHALANHLDADQPVYALQSRSLDGNIIKGQSLEEMAAGYVKELRSLQPTGPYYIAGFCFGGLLALEAAQQLTDAGEDVALLILIQSMHPASARFKPGIGRIRQAWYRTSNRMGIESENFSNGRNTYIRERFQRARDIVLARAAIRLDNALGNNGQSKKQLPMRYILEAITIENDKISRNYRPRPYYGDVALFRASKQLKGLIADENLGWSETLRGNVGIWQVHGHQQNILLEPYVSPLAAELASRLKAAQHGREVQVNVA